MDGDDMSHCLDLLFRLAKEMNIFEYELAIAAYIFGNNLASKKVLVPDDHYMDTHETFRTIMPDKPIIGDIFVPIYLNGYWFLIVVNLFYETVRYMDLFKHCTSMTERKSVIDDVLTYLEKFVFDKNFQETPLHKNLQLSKYKFSEPAVPQQNTKSNDCGIWFAEWMILNHYWGVNKLSIITQKCDWLCIWCTNGSTQSEI
ncbi:hypothetical protein Ahy_A02g009576 [Arachis hypogaea]|uniref:Ubiquitin-like protease family profile domain-containing protein n=1 Tax=Arachis hypogaea TaxID=3818 RepID=A0A445EHF3_ARAHY|nr:hypothetical protein Ahy_A02g009576 [Arachis hypogaea]